MTSEPTQLDNAADKPPSFASDALFEQVYDRLKAMAGNQLRQQNRTPTLNTTMLVHELYLRMGRTPQFADPAQFFAYAARAMRHILIDRARARLSEKGGGQFLRVALTEDCADQANEESNEEYLAIESAQAALTLTAALDQLAALEARAAQVVELRYFAGLSLEQVAQTLQLTRRTIDRDWRFARAFLKTHISGE
jgi:RNA polymerase sigma factor (TIGR02999 family)